MGQGRWQDPAWIGDSSPERVRPLLVVSSSSSRVCATRPTLDELASSLLVQSINQPPNQPINQSINQPTNQSQIYEGCAPKPLAAACSPLAPIYCAGRTAREIPYKRQLAANGKLQTERSEREVARKNKRPSLLSKQVGRYCRVYRYRRSCSLVMPHKVASLCPSRSSVCASHDLRPRPPRD